MSLKATLVQLTRENWSKLKAEAALKGVSVAYHLDCIIAERVGAPLPEPRALGRPSSATTAHEQEVLDCFPETDITERMYMQFTPEERAEFLARASVTLDELREATAFSKIQINRSIVTLLRKGALLPANDRTVHRGKRILSVPTWIRSLP